MDQHSTEQLASLDFAIRALHDQVGVLQDDADGDRHELRALDGAPFGQPRVEQPTAVGRHRHRRGDRVARGDHGRGAYDGDLARYADEVSGRTLAMWSTDGVLDSTHVTPLGELPGSVVINFAIIDALCHAWDLSASVGHPIEFPPEAIPAISLVVEATCTDAAREHGLIKPVAATPADATDTERLMATAGRSIPR